MLSEFRKFVLRGNLVDLAIGFTVGAAFTTVARSLVEDIIMPPVGLLTGGADFADLFVILQEGSKAAAPYATLAEAQAAGAVTLNYGNFLNNFLALLLVALVMFMIIRSVNRIQAELAEDVDDSDDKATDKKCPYCKSVIDIKATRCPQCTSELPAGTAAPPA